LGVALKLAMSRAAREVRIQAGVVRALLEELDAIDPAFDSELERQVVEELARLGCRILEVASAMSVADVSKTRLRDPDVEAPVGEIAG
jgi:hypothetical protein